MMDFKKSENTLDCFLKGRMGTDNTEGLSQIIQGEIDDFCIDDLRINFDLKDVDYVASSFIRICVATAKQLGEGNFTISNTSPLIKKVFKIAGLHEILNVS